MNSKFYSVISILFFVNEALSVPPEACFANFNWDDCGKPPVPVMYYWKPGSRCEVGFWRGCLPNINMFQDEYECVSTCIFTIRAMQDDYHNLLNVPEEQELVTSPPIQTVEATTDDNAVTTVGSEDVVTTEGGAGNDTSGNNTDAITTAAPAA